MAFTYILRCSDGSLYTGWTIDLQRRIEAHNRGRGARYTRSRLPVELLYSEEYDSREEAMKRECEIKQMTRQEKLALAGREKRHDGITAV